jgi:hypothetical protein
MSDNNAARKGDEIIHSSIFADITSIVAEGAAYAVIGAAVGAAATVAAPLLGAGAAAAGVAAIGSSCLLSGIIGGVLANVAGITDDISNAAEGLGNALFPPSPAGKITTGSSNVLTNAIPAARAAGTLTPADTPSPEPQSPGSFADYAGMLLSAAGQPLPPREPRRWKKTRWRAKSTPGRSIWRKVLKASLSTGSPRCVLKIAPPARAPFPMTSPRT